MHEFPVQPWYRQFWPWFIFSLPAAAVAASFVTLYLAGSEPAMVVDDYGRIAKATAQRAERRDYARELGLVAELNFEQIANTGNETGEWAIRLTTEKPGTVWPTSLILQLVHPTQEQRDQRIELNGTAGVYRSTALRPQGRYYVALMDAEGNWRLAGELARNANSVVITADRQR
jgi:hypothetical protein